ncbi:MAG: hypothetical protein H7Y31_04950 [Chitinophagaceae bacterium]|nr:hypothetical protein [Chitinophagaceae bacterium]
MKRNLLLLLALPLIFAACTKTVIVPEEQENLVGRWQLSYAEKQGNHGSQEFYTGYEEGYFYFYQNGQAEFDDGYERLTGTWELRWVNDGYYDYNGNYQSGSRRVFRLYLSNGHNGHILDWDFDEGWFNNRNNFTASFDTYNYTYRYSFIRR